MLACNVYMEEPAMGTSLKILKSQFVFGHTPSTGSKES